MRLRTLDHQLAVQKIRQAFAAPTRAVSFVLPALPSFLHGGANGEGAGDAREAPQEGPRQVLFLAWRPVDALAVEAADLILFR
jgi:hypothetical protein